MSDALERVKRIGAMPAIPLTDPRFKYVNAAQTDLAKTFARVRKELALRERVERSADNVAPLRRAK